MGKIWLALLGVLLCTPIYASNLAAGIIIGSAMNHGSNHVVSGGVSTQARVYSCRIRLRDIDDDEDRNEKIVKCAKRLQSICSSCVLGRLHSVAENENGVNINFEIVDTEEIKHDIHEDIDNVTH